MQLLGFDTLLDNAQDRTFMIAETHVVFFGDIKVWNTPKLDSLKYPHIQS